MRWWRQPFEEQPLAWLIAVRLKGALMAMLVVATIATGGYIVIEGYGWIDAIYMTVITLGTIGYGEVRPLDTAGRVLTMALIIAGFAAFVYAASILTSFFTSGEAANHLRAQKARRMEAELENHVIVVGYGRVGHAVVESLTRMGRTCVVLDHNAALAGAIEAGGALHVVGDATDEQDLVRAGIRRAAAFVAAADQDADNLVVVLTARAVSPTIRIVSRVNDSAWLTRMERAGANVAQSPYGSYGDALAASALSAAAGALHGVHMLGLGLGLGTEEMPVSASSPLVGKVFARLDQDYARIHLLGVRRDGELLPWHDAPDPVRADDALFVIGLPENLAHLADECGPSV